MTGGTLDLNRRRLEHRHGRGPRQRGLRPAVNLGPAETIAGLTGTGIVNLNGNTLTVGNTTNLSSTFSGAIGDGPGRPAVGAWSRRAAEPLRSPPAAPTAILGPPPTTPALLVVNGSLTASTVTVASGATLRGTGTVFKVAARQRRTVAPGDGPGTLTTGNFALASGSIFTVELGGTAAGQYDQVVVTTGGTVNLNSDGGAGATLALTLVNGFLPAVGNTFTIINNQGTNPVAGTFAQGATCPPTVTLTRSATRAAPTTTVWS